MDFSRGWGRRKRRRTRSPPLLCSPCLSLDAASDDGSLIAPFAVSGHNGSRRSGRIARPFLRRERFARPKPAPVARGLKRRPTRARPHKVIYGLKAPTGAVRPRRDVRRVRDEGAIGCRVENGAFCAQRHFRLAQERVVFFAQIPEAGPLPLCVEPDVA